MYNHDFQIFWYIIMMGSYEVFESTKISSSFWFFFKIGFKISNLYLLETFEKVCLIIFLNLFMGFDTSYVMMKIHINKTLFPFLSWPSYGFFHKIFEVKPTSTRRIPNIRMGDPTKRFNILGIMVYGATLEASLIS
jgi:hypothetical protein